MALDAGTGTLTLRILDGAGKSNSGAGHITLTANNWLAGATITLENLGAETTNAIQLGAGGTLSASGPGDAITLASDIFTNNAGAGVFDFTGGGRFLVFSNDFATDTAGGPTARHFYNHGFGDTLGAVVSGSADNWFLYRVQPTLTVTGTDTLLTYDGTSRTLGGFTAAGLVNGDSQAQALTTDPTLVGQVNAGTYTMGNLTGGASEIGYAITLLPGTLTIDPRLLTVTATAADKVYDGTTAATVIFGDDRVAGDVLTLAGTANFADKNVGTGKTVTISGITLGGADAGNYGFNTSLFSIASITPRGLEMTADPGQLKLASEPDPTFTFTLSGGGLVAGDGLAGALARVAGEVPGNYGLLMGTLTAGANYDVGFVGNDFTVLELVSPTLDFPLEALPTTSLFLDGLPTNLPDGWAQTSLFPGQFGLPPTFVGCASGGFAGAGCAALLSHLTQHRP